MFPSVFYLGRSLDPLFATNEVWDRHAEEAIRGFEDPVKLWELRWQEAK